MNMKSDIKVSHTDELIADGRCALIYVIDPPFVVSKSIPLLLSLREHYPTAKIIPYVPKEKYADIPERILKFHQKMDATPRPLTRELAFNPKRYRSPYKHGNKILAAAEKRDTEFCIFLDTDTYLAQPFNDDRLCQAGAVAAVPESVAGWSGRFMEIWDATYNIFSLETPEERVRMLRTDREQPPYFNAGFVAFPEVTPSGERFGELWLDTALTIDFSDAVENERKRPWLDQGSLPVAIRRSGARFEILESSFNYPVDQEFLPHADVRLYHYHGFERLRAAEHTKEIERLLTKGGHFASFDHFESSLTKWREANKPLSAEIAEMADERRRLKPYITGETVCDTMSSREARQATHKLKALDREVRDKKDALIESLFYDDDWLKMNG